MIAEYLGDAVYVVYKQKLDELVLTTGTADENNCDDKIYLEWQTLEKLIKFIERIRELKDEEV